MTHFLSRSPLTALLAALVATSAAAQAPLEPAAASRLAAWQQAPDAAGELVYRVTTFALNAPTASAEPLFRYTRRVREQAGERVATHLTQTPSGLLLIAETGTFGPGYALHRFEAINQQQGYSGSAQLSADGSQLAFELTDRGQHRTATETVSAPVVSGPTLHGFVHHHWDSLAAGQSLPVRLIVLQKMQTYGFDIRLESTERTPGGHTVFAVTPSSFFVRLAVPPLRVVFDTASRQIVRYEGRVPPMQVLNGRLQDLDARVEYETVTAGYQ